MAELVLRKRKKTTKISFKVTKFKSEDLYVHGIINLLSASRPNCFLKIIGMAELVLRERKRRQKSHSKLRSLKAKIYMFMGL
jgi:hypothetical protein